MFDVIIDSAAAALNKKQSSRDSGKDFYGAALPLSLPLSPLSLSLFLSVSAAFAHNSPAALDFPNMRRGEEDTGRKNDRWNVRRSELDGRVIPTYKNICSG